MAAFSGNFNANLANYSNSSASAGLTAKSRSNLPECATQQVCNAIFVRMNYTQRLCECSNNFNWKCSNNLDPQDGHTIELTRKFDKRVSYVDNSCEIFSIYLAFQSIVTFTNKPTNPLESSIECSQDLHPNKNMRTPKGSEGLQVANRLDFVGPSVGTNRQGALCCGLQVSHLGPARGSVHPQSSAVCQHCR